MLLKQLIILYALQNEICISQKQIYSSARSVSESAEHYLQSKSKKGTSYIFNITIYTIFSKKLIEVRFYGIFAILKPVLFNTGFKYKLIKTWYN